MVKIAIYLIVGYFAYQYILGDESGCDTYASKYSCDYVENKASYDVYYWHNLEDGNSDDEKYIGSAIGLRACQSFAVDYANSINARWNTRSYICVLKQDGRKMEKHRL
ncbi:hypothetical protein OAD22_01835 [Pseudomonadales bacterium]|nr:hypothetical protein [Pseudomonadales bacterium]MDB9868672.1 hypothetical protein [Pseudomonadales bacterium]MDB9916495.1 hypothetical protein [Pseudomonadales bacterium]MDC1308229.1 hypothetical protein [Pseudomonadales bacterium]MDC1368638.1 hypothetical protein [Pseudomonadales bacterium]|tara:strand:- start:3088 stop:3411 length:324 start_codon:yes stop_codon:yes gene_type:complete